MSNPTSQLSFEQLESLYDELAGAIDEVGIDRESVFLTKLVLRLSSELGDVTRISTLIQECAREPEPVAGNRIY